MAEGFQRGKISQREEDSITTHTEEIRRGVNPKHVTGHLKENSIISSEDIESINSLPTRLDRVDELMSVIRHRGPHAFRGFINALNAASYSDLARKLKDTAEKQGNTGAKPKKPTTHPLSQKNSPSLLLPLKKSSVPTNSVTPQRRGNTSERRPVSGQRKVAVVRGEPKRPALAWVAPKKKSADESVVEETVPKQIATPTEGNTSGSTAGPIETISSASEEIYQSLNNAHEQVTSHVDAMLPMLDSVSSDDENIDKEEMKKRLAEHMTAVANEKRAVDRSSTQGEEKFNRDMILMVFNMNKMLSFMMDVLQKLVVSLKGKGTDYENKIETMNDRVQQLQEELEAKHEELTELKRDHHVETYMLTSQLKSAVQALEKASSNFNIRTEREMGDMKHGESDDNTSEESSGDSSDDSSGFVPCYSSEPVYLRADRTGTDNNQRGRRQKDQKPKTKRK